MQPWMDRRFGHVQWPSSVSFRLYAKTQTWEDRKLNAVVIRTVQYGSYGKLRVMGILHVGHRVVFVATNGGLPGEK